MKTLMFLPVTVSVDTDTGHGSIEQRFGPDADDFVNIQITKDQAVQIAEFLIKEFKVKKAERVSGTDDGFEVFWKSYPPMRRTGKDQCLAIWKRGNYSSQRDEILIDLEAHKVSVQWTDKGGRFIPLPATYLNRKGWVDKAVEASTADL